MTKKMIHIWVRTKRHQPAHEGGWGGVGFCIAHGPPTTVSCRWSSRRVLASLAPRAAVSFCRCTAKCYLALDQKEDAKSTYLDLLNTNHENRNYLLAYVQCAGHPIRNWTGQWFCIGCGPLRLGSTGDCSGVGLRDEQGLGLVGQRPMINFYQKSVSNLRPFLVHLICPAENFLIWGRPGQVFPFPCC